MPSSHANPIHLLKRGYLINPLGEAIIDGDVRITYAKLLNLADGFACFLQEEISCQQARIGICARNNWQHLVAMLGVFSAGHTWVPLNPRLPRSDLNKIANAANLALIVSDEEFAGFFDALHCPKVIASGCSDQETALESICARFEGRSPVSRPIPNGIMAIKFTGGTTGSPKGVLQPYRAFTSCIASILTIFGFNENERMLAVAPLTHGAGTFVLPVLGVGGCHVLLDGAKAPEIVEVMANEGVTATFMPPTLIYAIAEQASKLDTKFPQLRHLIYGAAPMPTERVEEIQSIFGGCLASVYGQTEAPSMIAAITAQELMDSSRHGSVGHPCPYNEVQIMDAEGRIPARGETGEIVVRGDLVMEGYLDRPDLTQKAIINGWLHTGDLGCFDEKGYLFIKGRLSEVIISGGFNVYPTEVEESLNAHPVVKEAVAFSMPDPYWGERVEAAVVVSDVKVTPETLLAFAKEQLGSVRAPKAIHILAEMPVNAVGKVARRNVAEIIAHKSKASKE